MIKVEVIEEFTLERYNELKNIQRRTIETKGKLYKGDKFECTKEMVDYLTGNNPKGKAVVKVIEIEPETKENNANPVKKQIKSKSNKSTKK